MKVTVWAGAVGDIFQDIFEPDELVAHLQQRLEAHVDFGLAGGGHFVVLAFHVDAELFQGQHHLAAQVLKLVGGRYGEVTLLVTGFVAEVRAFVTAGVPDPLHRIDGIEGAVFARFVLNVIEDEEFGLGADKGRVAHAGALEIGFGLLGDVARGRGCKVRGLIGSTMLPMSTRVGWSKKGSILAVLASGTTSMSLALMGCHPRMLDPSKPKPSSKLDASSSLMGTLKCCQMPGKSMKRILYDLCAVFLCHCQSLFSCHRVFLLGFG